MINVAYPFKLYIVIYQILFLYKENLTTRKAGSLKLILRTHPLNIENIKHDNKTYKKLNEIKFIV